MKPVRCEIEFQFKAPLKFAYPWCTNFQPIDSKLEKEHYTRKIIERTRKRVIFEDLEEMRDGWVLNRTEVKLRPPNRWDADSHGNRRDAQLHYQLKPLPGKRTQLLLQWTVWPKTPAAARLTAAKRERSAASGWKNFAAALEKDYRNSLKTHH
jgi:hypothetical protein